MKTTRYLMASGAVALALLVASPVFADMRMSANGLLGFGGDDGLHRGSGIGVRASGHAGDNKGDKDDNRNEHAKANVTIPGTVSAISGSTITLNGANGVTYTVNASSTVMVSDRDDTVALSDISVGDMLIVKGTPSGSVITAKKIRDVSFARRAFLSAIGAVGTGVVTAINGSTFTLKSRGESGTTTVSTNASTTYKLNGVATTSSALSVGSRVIVFGTTTSPTSITASLVSIINLGVGFFRHLFFPFH